MTDHVKALFDQARKLTAAEREALAALLIGSLDQDPAIEQAWAEEAQTRWNAHVASSEQRVDAFAAVDEARRQLQRPPKA